MYILKELLIRLLKRIGIFFELEYCKGIKQKYLYEQYKDDKKIFFLMTPTYGNLGDQAIEIATYNFLKKNFFDYKLIRVHLEDTYITMKAIEQVLLPEDVIILQGGGNFGNLYNDVEQARRFIVKKLTSNRIVSMPSTLTYTEGRRSKRDFKKSLDVYSNHNAFLIIAREKFSYEYAINTFSENDIEMFPDIVFSLWKPEKIHSRDGIMLCIRQDEESIIKEGRDALIMKLSNIYKNTQIVDTQVTRRISDSIKELEVNSMLNNFSRAKVVVTDRLHGLIFSVITNTPCVVLPSLDNKIAGTYEWIKELNYVKFLSMNEIDQLKKEIDYLLNLEKKEYIDFEKKYFDILKEFLRKYFEAEY